MTTRGFSVRPGPTTPMSRRPAGVAHDARAAVRMGRKAVLEDFPYG